MTDKMCDAVEKNLYFGYIFIILMIFGVHTTLTLNKVE